MEKFSQRMNKPHFWFYVAGTIIVVVAILFLKPWQQSTQTLISSPATPMEIISGAFENNTAIPSQYTCDGKDMSPPLRIQDAPANAKSLALMVHDPDAPRQGGWTHWVVWNIDPATKEIAENTVPAGAVQGRTDSGTNKWGGPCPPSGTHHYQFMLYALDTMLDLPDTTTKSDLEKAMAGHIMEQSTLVGTYARR